MNNTLSQAERLHLARIKGLPCGVCGSGDGIEAHHVEQNMQYLCIPLCAEWRRHGLGEMEALAWTIERLA